MAQHLNAIQRGVTYGLLCMLSTVMSISAAEELFDPTRPATATEAVQAAGGQAAAPTSVLQSVLISGTRREAIIGAQVVRVGDRFGDAKVAQILEDRVVLRNEKGMQTLKLFPGIEKRVVHGRDEFSAAGQRNNIEKIRK